MTPAHLPPDDADLGRLLGDAVRRQVSRPVDQDALVSAARSGAVRLRRRRRTGVAVLAVVLLAGVPVGVIRHGGGTREQTASSAAPAATSVSGSVEAVRPQVAGGAADSGASGSTGGAAAPSAAAAGSAVPREVPSAASSGRAMSAPGPAGAAGAAGVPVPDAALLAAADLPQAGWTRTSDSANRQPAADTPGSATCGQLLVAPSVAAGSRSVTYERRSGPSADWWQLTSTVRVYPGAGAQSYLAAARTLSCAVTVAATVGQTAVRSSARIDATGRSHQYAVVEVGRTIAEITVVTSRGPTVSTADLARLLAVAAGRLSSSGLAASAQTDPALAG